MQSLRPSRRQYEESITFSSYSIHEITSESNKFVQNIENKQNLIKYVHLNFILLRKTEMLHIDSRGQWPCLTTQDSQEKVFEGKSSFRAFDL